MTVVAAGLVVVALDFRTRSVDLLPDVMGWLLVGAGARMARVPLVAPLAVGTAVLNLSELALPYHLVRFSAESGEFVPANAPGAEDLPIHHRWNDLSQLRGAVIAAAMTLGAVTVVALLRTLRERACAAGDQAAAHELRVAMVAPALWAVPFVLVVASTVRSAERYDPVWEGGAEAGWLLALVALLGLAELLVLRRDRGWAFVVDAEAEPGRQDRASWRAFGVRQDGESP